MPIKEFRNEKMKSGARYKVHGMGHSNLSPSFLVNQATSRLARVFHEAIQKKRLMVNDK
jgi:hypothetical protein